MKEYLERVKQGFQIRVDFLREIAGHLEQLAADSAYDDAIDLRSLPMSDTDRDELMERLGKGEVVAVLDLAGETRVTETAYPGVWHIAHMGEGGRIASELVAITRVPEILQSHPDDIAIAAARLRADIAPDADNPAEPVLQGER